MRFQRRVLVLQVPESRFATYSAVVVLVSPLITAAKRLGLLQFDSRTDALFTQPHNLFDAMSR
jgi:hypothetical protein